MRLSLWFRIAVGLVSLSIGLGATAVKAADVSSLLNKTATAYQDIKNQGSKFPQSKIDAIDRALSAVQSAINSDGTGGGDEFPLLALCQVKATYVDRAGKYDIDYVVRFYYPNGEVSDWNVMVKKKNFNYMQVYRVEDGRLTHAEDYSLSGNEIVIKRGQNASNEVTLRSKYYSDTSAVSCRVDTDGLSLDKWK